MARTPASARLPVEVWLRPDVQRMCSERDVNGLLRLAYLEFKVKQEHLAYWIGQMTASEVCGRVNGKVTRAVRAIDRWQAIADALGMSDHARELVGLARAHPTTAERRQESPTEDRELSIEDAPLRTPLNGRERGDLVSANAVDDGGSSVCRRVGRNLQQSVVDFHGVLTPDDEERMILAVRQPCRLDARIVDSYAAILARQRETEDVVGSEPLIEPVRAQLAVMEHLVMEARGPGRAAIVDLASQWAGFAGWLNTSTGRATDARAWLDRAAEWATECGNCTMASTALSFKGHLEFLQGRIPSAVGLTQAAQRDPSVWVGQRAYEAYQEARGLAFLGESGAAIRKADEGSELVVLTDDQRDRTPPWAQYYTAPFYALERAFVYRYLGREDAALNVESIASFTAALDDLGSERSSEWAAEYSYHLALAYVQAGAPDKAHETAMEVLGAARSLASERLLARACQIHARLAARWPYDSCVTDLEEALQEVV